MPGAMQIVRDPLAELLDDMAALGSHWQRNRAKDRTPWAIRRAMLDLAGDIVAQRALIDAAECAQEP